MLIAIDYDDTFTRDPDGWLEFMIMMKLRGHKFVGCTMRYEKEMFDVHQTYKDTCDFVVPTGRKAKRRFLANMDIHPHVWIDDIPDFIVMDAK